MGRKRRYHWDRKIDLCPYMLSDFKKSSKWSKTPVLKFLNTEPTEMQVRILRDMIRRMDDYLKHKSNSVNDKEFYDWLVQTKEYKYKKNELKFTLQDPEKLLKVFRILRENDLIEIGYKNISKLIKNNFHIHYSENTIYDLLRKDLVKSELEIKIITNH